MPLVFKQVRGRPVGLFARLLDPGVTTKFDDVDIVVAAAGAAQGANVITVDALPVPVPKNTILIFSRAAGDPDEVKVVVNEDAEQGATELSVEMFEGEEGEGLRYDLAAADEATFDQLYTVTGTENSPFTNNPTTQNLFAVTYGASTGVSVTTPEVTTIAPQIARTGLFLAEGQLVQDILAHADTNREWWVKQVMPDATGLPWGQRQGRAKFTDLNHDKPADGLVRLAYTIRFVGRPDFEKFEAEAS